MLLMVGAESDLFDELEEFGQLNADAYLVICMNSRMN